MNLKRIPMDGPKNFRDIGGYLNTEGKLIAWNKIYRSDGLSGLSEADKQRFKALNIKTIVDLRSKAEQQQQPDIIPEGVTCYFCPLMREEIRISHREGNAGAFGKSLVTGYITMMEEAPDLIAAAVNAVMEGTKRGAVVYHCTAGKDRTGVLTAVLLSMLKAYEEDITADYQVTHTYNEKGVNLSAKKILEQNPEAITVLNEDMLSSHPETIIKVLTMIKETDIFAWLIENGAKAENIEIFCKEMLFD